MKTRSAIFLGLSITTGLLWIQTAVLAQSPSATPIRLGDVARQLSDQDITALGRALPAGGKPWLLIGEALGAMSIPVQNIEAFLLPETTTREVRRGMMIPLRRSISDPAKPEPWTSSAANYPRGRTGSYAQVAVAGRTFDDMQGDQDINRPFVVDGVFEDAELVSIVSFIRSNPVMPNSPNPIRAGPVHTIVRQPDDSVMVWIRRGAAESQVVTLRKQGQGWVITAISLRSA